MRSYRKKPVTVEAFQLHIGCNMPLWFQAALHAKEIEPLPGEAGGPNGWGTEGCVIHSAQGMLTVNLGDWVIREPDGAMYPCRPAEFAATYEAAE